MISLILFILILGTIILIHEFGHFIFSKMFGVYVYEYSIGMGKKIWSKRRKNDETEYSIRLLPVGGFCSLAGETGENTPNEKENIPEDKKLYKKSFIQRFLIFFMGPGFNFLLAFIVLYFIGLFIGGNITTLKVADLNKEYPAYTAGMRNGDTIREVNGEKVSTWTEARLRIMTADNKSSVKFKIEDKSGNIKNITIKPIKEKNEQGEYSYIYGISCKTYQVKGFIGGFKYMYHESKDMFKSLFLTVKYLFVGKVGINDMTGPVGIYKVVDEQKTFGITNLLYLLAYLSINVGVMNLIPFPAFDGGHILFLLIEKIIRKPVPSKIEGIITTIGFACLIVMMIYVTGHDIFNLVS